ncbi:hypothetical protein AJ80_01725 [Polytolypa hystricis UAMH7299]|uniref:Lactamase-like protein nscB n=1 Tax=Polytolypa hystricis (strain UAMH7299) TaxID=1447883 RepID=A0A2B7YY42_POLH7|nr:hypothetical protein AJ80_01725 [Polytolypa hystricis UAMH7299]
MAVPLPEVERLSASVVRILAGNPGKVIPGTNTYLIGRGPQRLLIDTGEGRPSWQAAIRSVLTAENATIQQALITHWHTDHTYGIPDLLKICPGVKIYKNDPDDGQLEIRDGQVFKTEGATLTALHTPGHTTDHVAFLFEEENAMFTGDNVLGHGTAVFEELSTYLRSLEKMHKLSQGRAYPGHGAVIEDCKSKVTEYIQHRRQREDEVLRVLRLGTLDGAASPPAAAAARGKEVSPDRTSGLWTPIELVKAIYRAVPEELHLPASNGVIQVLMKLEQEGKVTHELQSGRWGIARSERPAL